MRVFLAGATGVIGRRLVPELLEAGHEVVGMTRSEEKTAALEEAGAEAVVCDVFDRERLDEVMGEARPDAVIHQLTALPERLHPRKIRRQVRPTNRIRREGTRNLARAARKAGAGRFLAQSIAFVHRPDEDGLAEPDDPLYLDAPRCFRAMVEAVATLELITLGTPGLEGVVLRYGYFYGPGTIYAPDGSFVEDVRGRKVPLVGGGDGVFSFVHVDDAAAATVAALEEADPGIYPIVGDDPAPIAEWLPHLASCLDAPEPWRVPWLLGRLFAGSYGVYLMCEQRGVSNRVAREMLGWKPEHPSWRDGFADVLGA